MNAKKIKEAVKNAKRISMLEKQLDKENHNRYNLIKSMTPEENVEALRLTMHIWNK